MGEKWPDWGCQLEGGRDSSWGGSGGGCLCLSWTMALPVSGLLEFHMSPLPLCSVTSVFTECSMGISFSSTEWPALWLEKGGKPRAHVPL